MTDEELMQAYLAGDAQAFDALYARYRAPVYRYIARLLPAGLDADGVYQECWLKLVRHRRRWSRDAPFRPWLYRIAHNAAVDALRAAGRMPFDAGDTEVAAAQPSVERLQWLRDCVERLLALVADLPTTQRDAFLLKEEAGLTLDEISAVAAVGRETVKSRLRYALNRLRRGLEGCEDA
jgi:RNA polymerase sigma-70 factor (ECF subfamily)